LGVHEVRTSQSLDLVNKKRAIRRVETFGTGTSRGGKVTIGLVLPVTPTSKYVIAGFSDLSNLSNTSWSAKTSTEFTDDKGKTKSISILLSGINSLLMPGEALRSQFSRRLTSGANFVAHLAAVGVIVEDEVRGTNFTTWRSLETSWEDEATEVTKLIRHLGTLEIHNRFGVDLQPFSMDALVHRSKSNSIKLSWDVKSWVSNVVTRVWFVDRVETNNSWVVSELLGNTSP